MEGDAVEGGILGEEGGAEVVGEVFDEVGGVGELLGVDGLGDGGVIEGFCEGVGEGRGGGEMEFEVEFEPVADFAFGVGNSVGAVEFEAGEGDGVGEGVRHGGD